MIRFSCYNGHIHPSKLEVIDDLSEEAMHKALEDGIDNYELKNNKSSCGKPLDLKANEDGICITADQVTTSSSIDRDCKFDEINIKHMAETKDVARKIHMKRSQSLGNELYRKAILIGVADSGEDTDQGLSADGSHDPSGSLVSFGEKDHEVSTSDKFPEALRSDTVQVSSDLVRDGSSFLTGDPQQKVEWSDNSDTQFPGDCSNHTPGKPRSTNVLLRSFSSSDAVAYGGHITGYYVPRATSCCGLNALDLKQEDTIAHKIGTHVCQDGEGDDSVEHNDRTIMQDPANDGYEGYNCVGTAKHWILPDEANTSKNQFESMIDYQEEYPTKDFKIKRIEEWVSNLQHCSPSEETHDLSMTFDYPADTGGEGSNGLSTSKQDSKITPGMESVKRYISSLSATSTSAQLANHGLVVIPFLSAFVGLKALNLSGNAIVRITAGALPRGLHVLNLSKNNISIIEGLRELTRLRVLDLSYNRILRIGHGLASCSSLKELYLAGNKISEVEGLHRLLKLNVLDFRFNKISTTKGLGQLAANYNSLQAISIEGNPALKNVGDEQLKKHLLGLLPHLVYYNRRSIKVGSTKDLGSARLNVSGHQFDRGLRSSELKTARKGSHLVAAPKKPPSVIHGRRNHQAAALVKPTRDKHGRLPPSGMRTVSRASFYDFGKRGISFKPDLTMHRSRSAGNLGSL
ncbi:Protein phosphatase 1 regulatory subunit pprA [Heracleum sosnowskyi]|uniref:Protein phosphatase 1 regulatory subunit pprA n=1 Tax=Heracleum sosnowskyi TaxID=360622 RepID=A0AAD8JJF9_9APIA|nr:Protein phosphatase 1 regulatory subunit pprA [Heracleum sosnowskyi]